jgi:hypothetical protein
MLRGFSVECAAMKFAADSCHRLGMKFSIYDTMRELSNRCAECAATSRAAVL